MITAVKRSSSAHRHHHIFPHVFPKGVPARRFRCCIIWDIVFWGQQAMRARVASAPVRARSPRAIPYSATRTWRSPSVTGITLWYLLDANTRASPRAKSGHVFSAPSASSVANSPPTNLSQSITSTVINDPLSWWCSCCRPPRRGNDGSPQRGCLRLFSPQAFPSRTLYQRPARAP